MRFREKHRSKFGRGYVGVDLVHIARERSDSCNISILHGYRVGLFLERGKAQARKKKGQQLKGRAFKRIMT
ncbi:uncharacterized protein H6S33_005605 [Morchella sextelata]|uniref:uncharacterized protein n=1 Tax=Morchella sextelata TaxID=1174677 RepID=UPI001D051ABA|nr:uncharacterized protein H6S33_005605 [Morchella sextelata]KAH0613719.1 hypothetical protein H6S33_005605 [Morchella sextelata]